MKITDVMTNIVGPNGLASSNRYQISFQFGESPALANAVGRDFIGVSESDIYETGPMNTNAAKLSYLADEVNIPGFSISTGDFEGHMPGMNQKYAHTKTFRDFTITFLMDHNHLPYKLLHRWAEFIFPFQASNGVSVESKATGPLLRNYVLTNYYNDYTCNMVIDKVEPTFGETDTSKKLRSKSTVFLYNVYPYLINDITVSNGPNQLLKFQASFYFEYSKLLREDN